MLAGYIVFNQYAMLMPDLRLPHDVPPRSRWGFACRGELEELERVAAPKLDGPRTDFWDKKYEDAKKKYLPCGVYAMIFGHTDVVEWLEAQGAKEHKKYIVKEDDKGKWTVYKAGSNEPWKPE